MLLSRRGDNKGHFCVHFSIRGSRCEADVDKALMIQRGKH